jgi:hypothetical protein
MQDRTIAGTHPFGAKLVPAVQGDRSPTHSSAMV